MYASNRRISKKQINRMIFLEIFGISTMWLPAPAAMQCGGYAPIAILIGGAFSWVFWKLLGRMGLDRHQRGLWKSKSMSVIYQIFFGVFAGYMLYKISIFCQREYLQKQAVWVIAAILFLLVCYGVSSGIEGMGRVGEILFVVCMIPFVLVSLLEIQNIQAGRLVVTGTVQIQDMLRTSLMVFVYHFLFLQVLFLEDSMAEYEGTIRRIPIWIVILTIIQVLLQLLIQGILGVEALKNSREPVLDILSMAGEKLAILGNFRTIYSGIWTVTGILTIIVCMLTATAQRQRKGRICFFIVLAITTIVFFVSDEAVRMF